MADYPQFVPHQVFELKPAARDSIRNVLAKPDSAELPQTIADQIAAELAASFKNPSVLVIVVRMKDAVEDVYDCTADAYLLAGGGTAHATVAPRVGLRRKRNPPMSHPFSPTSPSPAFASTGMIGPA